MTSRRDIEQALRAVYAARTGGDREGSIRQFADDAVFSFNGRGIGVAALGEPAVGKAAVRATIAQLFDAWKFEDWKELALLVDGERAVLHSSSRVTFLPTGRSEVMDFVDLVTFRDGQIVAYRQMADTAMAKALTEA